MLTWKIQFQMMTGNLTNLEVKLSDESTCFPNHDVLIENELLHLRGSVLLNK